MRCEDVRENIADYIAGTLTAEVESRLDEHAEQCASCLNELEELRAMWADLGQIPAPKLEASEIRAAVLAAMSAPGREQLNRRLFNWRFDMREALKAVAIIVVLTSLAAGASMFLSSREETDPPSKIGGAHVRGPSSAPITLVEYGDYECPPCVSYYAVVSRLLQKYPDSIKHEYRHFPLTKIHANALPAAVAAEAAGEQGKFWEMHDLLLTSQNKWHRNPQARDLFVDMAKQLGLDVNVFSRSLESSELEQRIVSEVTKANGLGIGGTPTFFMNGKKVELTDATFEGFDNLIIDQLKLLKLQRLK